MELKLFLISIFILNFFNLSSQTFNQCFLLKKYKEINLNIDSKKVEEFYLIKNLEDAKQLSIDDIPKIDFTKYIIVGYSYIYDSKDFPIFNFKLDLKSKSDTVIINFDIEYFNENKSNYERYSKFYICKKNWYTDNYLFIITTTINEINYEFKIY